MRGGGGKRGKRVCVCMGDRGGACDTEREKVGNKGHLNICGEPPKISEMHHLW